MSVVANFSNCDIDSDFCFPCSKCSLKFSALRDFRKHMCLEKLDELQNKSEESELRDDDNKLKEKETIINANIKPSKDNKVGEKPSENFQVGKYKHLIEPKKNKQTNILSCKFLGCGETFMTREKMRTHMKEHKLLKKSVRYICDVCDYDANSENALAKHIVKHTKEKNFLCHKCDKSFAWELGLKLHMKRHLQQFDFECDQCKLKFGQRVQLKRHTIVAHVKLYPNICSICGERFVFSTDLKRHTTKHTGEKPYKCGFCKMTFRLSGTQRKHELIHKDIKSFPCSMCTKQFRASDNLKVHMKRHMNQRDYICKSCKKGFIEPAGLRKHKCLYI